MSGLNLDGKEQAKGGLTTRAPDAGDSHHFISSFLRLRLFLAGRLRRPLPSAGTLTGCYANANRWAAHSKNLGQKRERS